MSQVIIRKKTVEPISEYDFGQQFINQLISDHKDEVNALLKKYASKDLEFASTEKKKEALKRLMKDQNAGFVLDLSKYISETANKRAGFKPLLVKPKPISMSLISNSNQFNATGGAYWSLGQDKYNEAMEWLQKQGYSADEAEEIISLKGQDAPELQAWNQGKNKFDWNLALDTTGKVAQSIFYLGSIFSKKEDPAPTMTDAENQTTKTKSNLTRNIIIAVVVVAILATTAYFLFKKK